MALHIHGIATPADPAVSPDGRGVSFTVSTIDVESDRYRRSVWIARDGSVERFTRGDDDRSARWSPDGRSLAFIRRQADRPAQLATIPADGGETRVVTDLPLGVASEPVWSPDGTTIAIVASVWREEWADLDDDERSRRPRRITRRDYRADDLGWTHDRIRAIHLVDVASADVHRLTEGERNETQPAWSPDGARLAFLSDRSEMPGFRMGVSVLEADASTGEVREAAAHGAWSVLAYRPDGVLHVLGTPTVDRPDHAGLWRLGGSEPEQVTTEVDRAMFSLAAGPPRLVFDGDTALASLVDRGAVGLIAVDPGGGVQHRHLDEAVVTGFDTAAGTTALTVSEVDCPGRLEIRRDDEVVDHRDLGTVTSDVSRPHALVPDHFVVDGPGAELDVWVYLPEGDEAVPLLLNIHGGPSSQFGWGYFDEFQVYAGAGFGVVATNPRGSTGYGRDFLTAVRGEAWGRVDVEDVDAVVDAALARHPRLDADRLGVMGGSYGGFLTAWLIAHQSRWRVAVVERALLSWPSFRGTSDIGGWFGRYYEIDGAREWDVSPLRLAAGVTTPTLVLHSENDFRCPIEQAEQYFAALLEAGVEAEFVRFPDEGHELSRSGSPRHRQERFDIILDWLQRL